MVGTQHRPTPPHTILASPVLRAAAVFTTGVGEAIVGAQHPHPATLHHSCSPVLRLRRSVRIGGREIMGRKERSKQTNHAKYLHTILVRSLFA